MSQATRHSRLAEMLKPDGPAPDVPPNPYWGPGRAGIVVGIVVRLVVFLAAMYATFRILNVIASIFLPSDLVNTIMSVPGVLIQITGCCVAYFLVVRVLERRRSIVELSPRRAGGLVIGLVCGAVAMAVCSGAIALVGGYRWSVVEQVDLSDIAIGILAAGVSAGIAEELLFRGIGYRLMEQLFGTWAAIIGSGVIFGITHMTNPGASLQGGISVALAGGLLFGVMYAWTRSLWVTIGYHVAWNIVQGSLLGIPVSGNELPAFLHTDVIGPDWATGGEFGAESSIITLVLMGALTIMLMVFLARRGDEGTVPPIWSKRPDLS